MTTTPPRPPKYVIGAEPTELSTDILRQVSQLETAALGHIMFWGNVDSAIKANRDFGPRTVGRALAVQCPGPDSTILHHAIGLAQPGDILVIDRLGDETYACLGGGVAEAAQRVGIIAAIIDGPCTDADELAEMKFPVWCRGTAPITTRLLDIAGRIHKPISCGGVVVMPGDVVLADTNGVFVLPAAEALYLATIATQRAEFFAQRRLSADTSLPLGQRSGATQMVMKDVQSSRN